MFEIDVFIVQKGLFVIEKVEDRFLTIYFHDLLHGNTGGYQGLHGVTAGYKGLPGVTRGYRRLQGVTGGYKGLQKVTSGYTGLQTNIENFF